MPILKFNNNLYLFTNNLNKTLYCYPEVNNSKPQYYSNRE